MKKSNNIFKYSKAEHEKFDKMFATIQAVEYKSPKQEQKEVLKKLYRRWPWSRKVILVYKESDYPILQDLNLIGMITFGMTSEGEGTAKLTPDGEIYCQVSGV